MELLEGSSNVCSLVEDIGRWRRETGECGVLSGEGVGADGVGSLVGNIGVVETGVWNGGVDVVGGRVVAGGGTGSGVAGKFTSIADATES